ncbi:hypothetical protein PPYR_00243 [Photinus pyralis]|uniref:Uncharacterized protein n=2 Tax=Photinus pyralis TaxID=7054 RepID=A0A1Y1LZ98_PHOPY|nr:maternal protein exuperantia-1-like [Photinus pyralis]XP_031353919.1 maternal protein exuperantia-1-like [Photinus pyralis]XP_031353920.1 maternal protein exuperantia-1-like [Photinus pyralis]XP_031355157.1 maternal protein exuperantia-1-like [Photinus pyralis]XP_031355162.1 maternal protein exuperantia-1-like [Photinus pyralis]XP_031355169.1 maternal protein exuperantia-1-like [Photinus pyralis]KAB0793388.1 hypothetical protein PPYR_13008 [Photinus pyralis]KAB0803273.1 hypothetical prote
MVQTEDIVAEDNEKVLPRAPKGVPDGNYKLIGWSIDTTGRRLIDEICQIAAYSTTSQFSQHIMPFSDLNVGSRRRHNLRIINIGRYRMLKNLKTNKFVKTKSEISALTDFLTWLEANRGDAKDGVILVYHEFRKTSPAMLLEALRRYSLIERFSQVVKGFANGFNIASVQCKNTTKSFSLRVMSRMLLNKEDDFGNAIDRAQAAFEVVVHLGQAEKTDVNDTNANNNNEGHISSFISKFVNPVSAEEEEIANFKVLLERQNTFRPVFGALMKATLPERRHASHLRRLLAENNIDYAKLQSAYESSAKDGIEGILKNEVPNAKEKDLTELLEILDCFFDPEKKAIQPKPRFFANQNRNPRSRTQSNNNKENGEVNGNNNSTEGSVNTSSSETTPRTVENGIVEQSQPSETVVQ